MVAVLEGDSSEGARTSDSASGRLSRLGPSRSLGEYFSPKAFLAVLALVSVGLFAGGTLLPIGALGRFVGLVVVTFLFGLLTSKRRYLELSVAGTAAGGLTTVLFDLPLAIAGSGRTLLAAAAAGSSSRFSDTTSVATSVTASRGISSRRTHPRST